MTHESIHSLRAITIAFWVASGLLACTTPLKPSQVHEVSGAAFSVVILKSSDNPLFDAPVAAFIASANSKVTVFAYSEGLDHGDLRRAVEACRPQLIYALGTKGALIARELFPEMPLMFAMVVNHKRLKLSKAPNVIGISLEPPPAVEFMMFKMVLPSLKRVLTFYSPDESSDLVEEARVAVEPLGVELVTVPVRDAGEIQKDFVTRLEGIDGIWYLNDPVVMSPEVFAFLRTESQANRLPFFSSLSDRFAQAGALMSVSVDLTSLGSQAAAMARALAKGNPPDGIGVQTPIGNKLVVNLDVATEIGIEVPDEVLPFINEVIVRQAATKAGP